MRAYVWIHPPEEELPRSWGEYDYKNSQFVSARILGGKRLEPDSGEAIMRFRYWALNKLALWKCPPCIGGRIVSREIIAVIQRFSDEEEVTFYPVTCICKDGISHDYFFVAPRLRLKCIDFDRSILTPDPLDNGTMRVTHWELLNFHFGCMGKHHIAWEEHLPRCMMVSEVLKDALLATVDKGLHFVLPRDYVKH